MDYACLKAEIQSRYQLNPGDRPQKFQSLRGQLYQHIRWVRVYQMLPHSQSQLPYPCREDHPDSGRCSPNEGTGATWEGLPPVQVSVEEGTVREWPQ